MVNLPRDANLLATLHKWNIHATLLQRMNRSNDYNFCCCCRCRCIGFCSVSIYSFPCSTHFKPLTSKQIHSDYEWLLDLIYSFHFQTKNVDKQKRNNKCREHSTLHTGRAMLAIETHVSSPILLCKEEKYIFFAQLHMHIASE